MSQRRNAKYCAFHFRCMKKYPTSTDVSKFLRLSFQSLQTVHASIYFLVLVFITKFPRKRSGQNRLVFVVFRMHSYDIRLKLVRKHSPAVFIQIQDGVREGPRKRANFPANLAQISAISRGRKSFFGSFVLVYCVSMKFFPINLNG